MTICRLRISRCVPEATNTHPQYVTVTAFPLQEWLHERSSLVSYIACVVTYCNISSLSRERELQLLQYCVYHIAVIISSACCSCVMCSTTVYFVEVCRVQSVQYLLLLFRSDLQFIFLQFFGFKPFSLPSPLKPLCVQN